MGLMCCVYHVYPLLLQVFVGFVAFLRHALSVAGIPVTTARPGAPAPPAVPTPLSAAQRKAVASFVLTPVNVLRNGCGATLPCISRPLVRVGALDAPGTDLEPLSITLCTALDTAMRTFLTAA